MKYERDLILNGLEISQSISNCHRQDKVSEVNTGFESTLQKQTLQN